MKKIPLLSLLSRSKKDLKQCGIFFYHTYFCFIAAFDFAGAVKKKCEDVSNHWPLDPPSIDDFCHFVE